MSLAEMDTIPAELKSLLDREKIRECVALLARGEDRRDADLIKAASWPDSTIDYGIFRGNFDEYLAWVVPGTPAVVVTQHVLGQSVIDPQGDAALAETHALSYHRLDLGDGDAVIGGRYLDRQDIHDCLVRFSRGMDRFDRDLFLSAFHPDATIAAGDFVGGPKELYDWASPMHEQGQVATQHDLLNNTAGCVDRTWDG
jgi:SnoaL-like domain